MSDGLNLGDFLNPKSMITPGAAGGVTMAITNALCIQFPGLPGNWTALVLSFLFGGAVVFAWTTTLLPRLIYLIINSLIIFMVSAGSNTVGRGSDDKPRPTRGAVLQNVSPEPQRASLTFPVVRGEEQWHPHLWLVQQGGDDDLQPWRRRVFKTWQW
jgi:hypothetical protein